MNEIMWRTTEGQYLRPEDMETSHIFHTINTIWNYIVPEEMATRKYTYWFNKDYYPKDYMLACLKALLDEFMWRVDSDDQFDDDILYITTAIEYLTLVAGGRGVLKLRGGRQ